MADLRKKWVNSNIPIRSQRLTLPSFKENGLTLREFITGGTLASSALEGKGLCLWGDSRERYDMFGVFAKELVIFGVYVYYATLHDIHFALEYGDKLDTYQNVPHLCIGRWEKGCEFPYSNYQRAAIEAFVERRSNMALPTHFDSIRPLGQSEWWSTDFSGHLDTQTHSFKV